MIYLISDTHWHHSNIIQYCSRPFKSVEEMNETMINNWNAVVKDEDEVYHLGDVAFRSCSDILDKLKGVKYLIVGNHDHKNRIAKMKQWKAVYENLELKINGRDFVLSHYPFYEDADQYTVKYKDTMLRKDDWPNYILLHGHVHNSKPKRIENSINMSVEHLNYTPLSEIQLFDFIKEENM